ncbi:hypothetical protein [Streptomyces sp. NPDC005336]|uniref:hypothetical protein n=1 Tax=Streptomyces sp. NPDC005336 TaxID=3157035 RepID=UPI0033A4189C
MRRLCAGSSDFLDTLDAAARAEVEEALAAARAWLEGHEDYQARFFADLEKAIAERRAFDVRSQLQQAAVLTRRGASASEQRILAAARALLRDQDHVGHTGPPKMVAKPVRRSPAREPRPKSPRARETRAAEEARAILDRLRRVGNTLPRGELASLTQELSYQAGRAGAVLDRAERQAVARWLRKTNTSWSPKSGAAPPRTASRPAGSTDRRAPKGDSRPDLDELASAVRTVLQRAAANGTTLTWSQVRDELPSGLPILRRADRVAVLVRVDSGRGRRAGLLSALVTGPDHDMHPEYPTVAAALGRPPASSPLEAVAQWAMEVSRVSRGGTGRRDRRRDNRAE